MVALAKMPRAPALALALTSFGPATQPIPVCTMGYLTPTKSQRDVCSRGAGVALMLESPDDEDPWGQ